MKAAVKTPSLFAAKSSTIAAKIEAVARHFTADGLTVSDYLQAALKAPPLFYLKPTTIAANLDGVVREFSPVGLTSRGYLSAVLKRPSLFTQSPETLARNINSVVSHFSRDGLTTRTYLQAAIKNPTLFSSRPQTTIGHINLLGAMHQQGLLPISPGSQALMDFIVKYPILLTSADDNLHLREIAAHLGDQPIAPVLKTRQYVEDTIRQALQHGESTNQSQPGAHARRLLLNALKREGYLKDR